MVKKVLTFIMAGGKGERLWPLTKDRTKPAVPFGGIYRIIDFTLSNCINSGLRKMYVLTQYKSASLQKHIRLGWNILSSELGEYIELLPAQQRVGDTWYLGTADAIYQNLYTLEIDKTDEVLILAGDHIYKMNYYTMIDFHREVDADLTVGVVEVNKERASHLGVVDVDTLGRVTGFQEKPARPKTIPNKPEKVYASMGIYVFKHNVLEQELMEDAKDGGKSNHDFGKDIIPHLIRKNARVFAYNFAQNRIPDLKKYETPYYWRDVGTIESYWRANMDLLGEKPTIDLNNRSWPIYASSTDLPPSYTINTVLDNTMVGAGVRAQSAVIKNSILGRGVIIGEGTTIEDSIIMDFTTLGRQCRIKKTIIDRYNNIPANAVIGGARAADSRKYFVDVSGITVVKRAERKKPVY